MLMGKRKTDATLQTNYEQQECQYNSTRKEHSNPEKFTLG